MDASEQRSALGQVTLILQQRYRVIEIAYHNLPWQVVRWSLFVPLLSAITLSQGNPPGREQRPALEAATRFCSLDIIGKRLTPGGEQEVAKEVLLAESPPDQEIELTVTKDYSLRTLRVQKDSAELIVDYHVLGRIDPSLEFVRLQTPYTGQIISQSQRFSLVLSDTHYERATDGRLLPVKGTTEWRIKDPPRVPHVSILAAMSYVRTASYRSKDPLVKVKAQKTLADLDLLSQSQFMPALMDTPSQEMPESILSQFIQMQMDGAGLTGSDPSLNMFVVHPAQTKSEKIGVAKAFAVQRTSLAVNKADAYVQYTVIAELDSQLRFIAPIANGNLVRQDYKLIFDNKYPPGNGGPYDGIGPSRWRIEEAPAEQWISVNAAIRYVTQIRDTTTDPEIKQNAEKTLASLSRYR